jgi:hypothetical protein
MITVNSGVNNYGGVPLIGANTLANRPAASIPGRLFVDTTNNLLQYDTGSAWVTIGGAGSLSGSGAAGQATFWTAASTISGDNAFFWDNINKRLGLGTTTPGARADFHGTGVIQHLNGTGTNNAYLDFQNAGSTQWRVGNTYNGGNRLFQIIDQVGSRNTILVNNNGQFGINMPTTSFFGINSAAELHYTTNQFIYRYFSYATSGLGVQHAGYYTRSATPGTFGATINNDVLLGFSAQGSTATGFTNISGTLRFLQNGTVGGFYSPVNMDILLDNGTGATGYSTLFNCTGFATFSGRLNVNNATDNALFELNNNGNFYTGGLSPTILTVSSNTTMARTATGYYCTATLTLTLPSAASLNNVYWVIAGSGVTVTVNRAGSDDILNLAGASVTSITISPNQRAMFYVGGGTRTFLISQA